MVDAVLLAVLGGCVWRWKSRVAALLLTLLSLARVPSSVMNLIGFTITGGNNVLLALAALMYAVKEIEATFKYHGRFGAAGPSVPRHRLHHIPSPQRIRNPTRRRYEKNETVWVIDHSDSRHRPT